MLGKEFFMTKPFNPGPYYDNVIVNLSGAQKFEEDTVFFPGRYRIELAPGKSYNLFNIFDDTKSFVSNMNHVENITQHFIIRAYCGSNGSNGSVGINQYMGIFKVNGVNSPSHNAPIDVTHIFGAGGGNGNSQLASPLNLNQYVSGGPNCLGDGPIQGNDIFGNGYGGAGSCLHLIPVGGVFGTDYIRAYHASPVSGAPGSAYGGAAGVCYYTQQGGGFSWGTRGGNSPYGNGGTTDNLEVTGITCTEGTGIGAGGKTANINVNGTNIKAILGAGAYFNGTTWIDEPGNTTNTGSSYIRVTYLGPLE